MGHQFFWCYLHDFCVGYHGFGVIFMIFGVVISIFVSSSMFYVGTYYCFCVMCWNICVRIKYFMGG